MMNALKEYGEIMKLSGKWVKKHWKGYSVFCLACGAVSAVYQHRSYKKFTN